MTIEPRETAATRGRRGRGRAARVSRRPVVSRAPCILRKLGPLGILGEEGLDLIEGNADRLLQEVGMEFRSDPEILAIFHDAGADVDGERVRFERGMCRRIIQASAPRQFAQHARNPANTVQLGGDHTVLCPSWGPPFVHDLDSGGRYATIDDFRRLVQIHHSIPYLHHSGGIVCEPVDVPANKRHFDMLYHHIRYSDRPFMGAFIGEARAQDAVDMAKIAFGEEFLRDNACLYAVSNTNAPLVVDAAMSGSLKVYARHSQPVACTPWTLAGASPCTVAGTLAQVLAEALATLCLVQLINPAPPVSWGRSRAPCPCAAAPRPSAHRRRGRWCSPPASSRAGSACLCTPWARSLRLTNAGGLGASRIASSGLAGGGSSNLIVRTSCSTCVRVMGHVPGAHQTGQVTCYNTGQTIVLLT